MHGRESWCCRGQVPEQMAPASSWWPQLWTDRPRWRHCPRLLSLPVHLTSSRKMGPEPSPNRLLLGAARANPQASCWHTTWAAGRSQRSSHTVPQVPPWWISTRPWHLLSPSASLTTGRSVEVKSQGDLKGFLPFFHEMVLLAGEFEPPCHLLLGWISPKGQSIQSQRHQLFLPNI